MIFTYRKKVIFGWAMVLFFSNMSLPAAQSKTNSEEPSRWISLIKPRSKTQNSSFNFKFNVQKHRLKNGLTVLLHVDKKAPLVNYQTWFRAGSKDDPQGQTGMAHLFEHLMFRGTKKREGTEFIKDIEAKGISYNAYTSYDETVYYFDLPKQELEFIAELEAERMAELAVNKKNLGLEQSIVKEERMMRYENNPQNLWIDLFDTAFKNSPYKWPVIGYAKDIDDAKVENCISFYETFYSPNNAVIVVSGPIHAGKTLKIIQKYYGGLKPSSLPKRIYTNEPEQKQQRAKDLVREVRAPSLALAYHTPEDGSKDSYSLEILSFILGGGDASRLHQLIVEKTALAVSVQAHNMALQKSGLFIIRSSLHPQKSLKEVKEAVVQEIKKLTEQKVSKEELSRAKTNIMKRYIDSLKTAKGKSSLLGHYETLFNDYSLLFKQLDQYNKVTAENILAAAKKYLNPSQQTLINLYPKK